MRAPTAWSDRMRTRPTSCHHRHMLRLRRRPRPRASDSEPRAVIDPNPLRTPDDAFETGFLIGALRNTWQAIAVKNLKDRRIATGGSANPPDGIGPAGKVAGHRAGEED